MNGFSIYIVINLAAGVCAECFELNSCRLLVQLQKKLKKKI